MLTSLIKYSDNIMIYNGNWTERSAICIGNHMVSSSIWNLHEWVFQKAEIARAASASAISLSEKLTSAN